MSTQKEPEKKAPPSLFKRKPKEPLKVHLSVAVRFGDEEDERVVLMDNREVRMVGSIFRYRDKMARFMVTGLFKAAMLQPKVAAKIFPRFVSSRDKS